MPRFEANKGSSHDFLSALDFSIEVFKEKIAGNGEDSYLYFADRNGGIAGVFDGCGGSGAKRYEKFQGKTGAYMASRAVSGAAKDWFQSVLNGEERADDPESLKIKIKAYLDLCKAVGGSASAFKGSLSKDFPTTAAIILATAAEGRVQAACMWAGDSRCYMLNSEGLKQLTKDDINGFDAMENLSADAAITNAISASKDFLIHQKTITLSTPCILFTATDGCFGYFSTPMEFEYLLLSTLLEADTVAEWEAKISAVLQEVAGDDYTISGMSLGFGTFANLKKAFISRSKKLYEVYIAKIRDMSYEEKLAKWHIYREEYSKYLSEG